MVTESWVPCEVCSYLLHRSLLVSYDILSVCMSNCAYTYMNWEFPTHPDQLSSIRLQLPYATRVWLERSDGIFSQLVDDLEVASKGIGVLVVFGGDVGSDCVGEEKIVSTTEGYREDVAVARHGCELSGEVLQSWELLRRTETESTKRQCSSKAEEHRLCLGVKSSPRLEVTFRVRIGVCPRHCTFESIVLSMTYLVISMTLLCTCV